MTRLSIAGVCLAFSLGAQAAQETPTTQRPAPSASKEEEDPGRPVLKRGGPAQKHEEIVPPPAKPTSGSIPESDQPAPPPPLKEVVVDDQGRVEQVVSDRTRAKVDDLIERAREAAFDFDSGLPNFICDQYTQRYESHTLKPDWKFRDRVEVELVYMSGKEDYRNVRINGKRIKKGSPEDSGTWSTGEFGTMLVDLFSPTTNARFTPRGSSTAVGLDARVYDFSVLKENSHWQIRFGGSILPAYKGSVWIDPKSARSLRLEMYTKQLPSTYQIDDVESVVDYGWVTISGQKFLLPMKSSNLACFRGTFDCVRNDIEFRNYRKFNVESQILTVDSDITFPEEETAQTPKSKTTPPSITPDPAKKKQ